MKKLLISALSVLISIMSSFAQIGGCTPSGTCDGANNHINAISIGTITHSDFSCSTLGYANYSTTKFFYGIPGEVYTAFVDWALYNNHMAVIWIDWNKNNDFTDEGEVHRAPFSDPTVGGTTVIQVPEDQAIGDTLFMRVGVLNNQGAGNEDPCLGSSAAGIVLAAFREVEDYLFIIDTPPVQSGSCTVQPSDRACEAWISDINIPDVNFSSFTDSLNCMTNTTIDGYSDFFDTRIATLDLGGSYPIDARNETYSDLRLACWIDWNIDGIFDNSETSNERIEIASSFPLLIHQGVINVPADAKQGKTRMRFKLYGLDGGTPANPYDPCGVNEFEVQDFGVIVGDPVQCANLTSPTDTDTDVCTKDVTLTWSAPTSGPSPTGYKVFLGTDMEATTLVNGQDVGLVTSYTYPLELPANTTYYWRIIAYTDDSEAYDCETRSFTTAINADPSIDQILMDGVDVDSAAVCADVDLAILANISGGTGTVDFAWTGDDIHLDDNSINNPTFNASGGSQTYTLRLTVIDANTCSARDSVKVYVKDAPEVGALSADKSSVCPNETVTLTLSGYNATITDWEKAEGANPFASENHTQDVLTTTISVDSKFKVLLTTGEGCEGESNEVTVTLKTPPSAPTIAVSPGNTACEGETISLTATPGTDIVWNDASNSTTSQIDVTTGGTYNVTYTDPATGCSATSANETITFNSLPAVPVVAISGTLCEGETVTLSTQYTTDLSWDVNGTGTATTATIDVSQDGTYGVTYTDPTTNCSSSSTENISFSTKPSAPIIEQSGDSLITNPAQVVNWLDAGGNVVATGESFSPDRTPGQTFTAVVVDGNNCESDESNEVAYDHTVSIAGYQVLDFAVYPNPATIELNIQIQSSTSAGIYQIKDMSGRTVLAVDLEKGLNTISLAEIQSGIYLLQNNTGHTIRIVKQ